MQARRSVAVACVSPLLSSRQDEVTGTRSRTGDVGMSSLPVHQPDGNLPLPIKG